MALRNQAIFKKIFTEAENFVNLMKFLGEKKRYEALCQSANIYDHGVYDNHTKYPVPIQQNKSRVIHDVFINILKTISRISILSEEAFEVSEQCSTVSQ